MTNTRPSSRTVETVLTKRIENVVRNEISKESITSKNKLKIKDSLLAPIESEISRFGFQASMKPYVAIHGKS